MTDEELEHMKRTVHDLCGVVLRLQIDLNGKPDLRDQFAMAALTGLVVANYGRKDIDPMDVASWAYGIADAMMEARK
jgi:hypothetical protein